MERSAIVIGAGPGGLAAAMLLAAAGTRVTVLERSDRVGGRTARILSDGFRFDRGPTFFLYPSVLRAIFQSAGRDLDREVDLIKLDPHYRLVFGGGGTLDATPDLPRLREQIARFCPADAAHIDRFLADNRRKLALFKPCLEAPFSSVLDVLRPGVLRLIPTLRPWNSLDRELRRYFSDPRVRLAFSFQSKYLGMSPFQCPALFSILSFLEYEHGVFHPRGGCSAVMDAMARILADMGVVIRLNTPAEEIIFSGRAAAGVRTAAGMQSADAVVINGDFAAVMPRLIPDALRRKWSDKKIAAKKYSCSTFMLYLGVKGRDELPHHSIYLAADYERNLADIEQRHVLSEDPSVYVQNACVTDPALAPPGHSALYILSPVTHQHAGVDWKKQAAAFRACVLNQLPRLGYDDIPRRIVTEQMTTPDDWAAAGPIYRGATFNLSHNLGQMLHRRPHNRFDGLRGVYLVGGGTHPGSGLPVIFESARITARLLLAEWGKSTASIEAPRPAPTLEQGTQPA